MCKQQMMLASEFITDNFIIGLLILDMSPYFFDTLFFCIYHVVVFTTAMSTIRKDFSFDRLIHQFRSPILALESC
ncbi:hypothetical protein HNY73_011042 [Argiope bruennichi]|uniref:Uncharacterized protein n=1 Tax=Argiope bruennichi TaxID=94029 RepID=A0A8T0F7V4_ARGBR|nr:hypothetical protein HNY73_011042 [Argiope bruennichi]